MQSYLNSKKVDWVILSSYNNWNNKFFDNFETFKIFLGKVEEQHFHVAPVILVNNARSNVYELLARQPRPGRDPSVATGRQGYFDVRGNETLVSCFYCYVLCAVKFCENYSRLLISMF